MTPLEIRLIAYILAGLAYTGFISWGSVTLTSHHYERIMAAEKLAQDQVVQQAQADVITAQAARRAAEDRADQETQKREQADTSSRDTVVGSVRSLETAVRARLLPAAVGSPGSVQGAQSGAAGDPRLPELTARLNASFDRLIGACYHEYEDRAAILSLEPKVGAAQ